MQIYDDLFIYTMLYEKKFQVYEKISRDEW
jgi:hypothetical protein